VVIRRSSHRSNVSIIYRFLGLCFMAYILYAVDVCYEIIIYVGAQLFFFRYNNNY